MSRCIESRDTLNTLTHARTRVPIYQSRAALKRNAVVLQICTCNLEVTHWGRVMSIIEIKKHHHSLHMCHAWPGGEPMGALVMIHDTTKIFQSFYTYKITLIIQNGSIFREWMNWGMNDQIVMLVQEWRNSIAHVFLALTYQNDVRIYPAGTAIKMKLFFVC